MNRDRLPDFLQRQDNSTPRCIRNAALLDGLLLSGKLPFTPIQRIGAVILGLLPFVFGIVAIYSSLACDTKFITDADWPAAASAVNLIARLWVFVLGAVFTLLGARIIFNALTKGPSGKASLHR